MNRRIGAFVALAVILAAVFVRLGIWQLDRLAQRQASNARIEAQLAEAPAPFDPDVSRAYRRVIVSGTPDFENEIVVTGRSRNGSPGVYIVTPVRVPGSIPAVLVNRGWVYAPDAATVDLARWREARTTYHGWVQPFAQPHASSPSTRPRSVRELTRSAAERLLPYPVTGVVIAQDSAGESTPARLPAPRLDNGPHLSYAIQWFSFAVIALAGAGAVVHRARQRDRTGATGA